MSFDWNLISGSFFQDDDLAFGFQKLRQVAFIGLGKFVK